MTHLKKTYFGCLPCVLLRLGAYPGELEVGEQFGGRVDCSGLLRGGPLLVVLQLGSSLGWSAI